MSFFDKIKILVTGEQEWQAGAGVLYAVAPNNNSADQVVTRALDTATRVNSSGNIETVVANKARIDYSLGTDKCPNLLVEKTRTNLFVTPLVPATQVITVVSATVYTISMTGSGSITLSGATTGVVTEGNPLTVTTGSTSLTCTLAGTVTSASVVTGQVAMSAANGTANADVISKTGLSALIPQTKGAIFFDGYLQAGSLSDSTVRSGLYITDGTNSNFFQFYRSNNTICVAVTVGGVLLSNPVITITSPLKNKRIKLVLKYELNNLVFYVNGAVVDTDLSSLIPACSVIWIGKENATYWDGLIKAIAITDELTTTDIDQFSQYATLEEAAMEMVYTWEA